MMTWLKGRGAGVALHWICGTLTLATLAAGEPGMRQAVAALLAVAAGLWALRTALAGPMARPGAALTGPARAAHLALHRGLLAGVVIFAAVGLAPDGTTLADWRRPLLFVVLGLATGHLLFNLWREALRGEKVLARMLPRS